MGTITEPAEAVNGTPSEMHPGIPSRLLLRDRLGCLQRERAPMTEPSITELDERIAIIRQNINELIEQAAAYSGAEDENRNADRIAQQEQELSRLIELRKALLRK